MKFNSAKSNVMVFCCNMLKDIPVPNFMLNGVAIHKVSNCKYLGHCINDTLIDDDDMARQRKQIYAQGNALVRKFYMCTETVRISLFKSYCSSLYTSSALNRCENYVLHTTMSLEKLTFCLETAVPVSCLPRVICQHVNF